MNENEICFIICTNNEMYLNECIYYINHLRVPEGMKIDIITVTEADSMTAGYNAAMHSSSAKYKVYLHQDAFCIHEDLIYMLLDMFKEDSIGMVGMLGATKLPPDAAFSLYWNYGSMAACDVLQTKYFSVGDITEHKYKEVLMLDGVFMATQYDIEWDEEKITGWHFYDASQSLRFREKGYRIVIPKMEKDNPFILHDEGCTNLSNGWDEMRKKFCEIYPIFRYKEEELNVFSPKTKKQIMELVYQKNYNEVLESFRKLQALNDSELCYVYIMLEVMLAENETYGESIIDDFNAFYTLYEQVKHLVRRIEYKNDEEAKRIIRNALDEKVISKVMLDIVIMHGCMQMVSIDKRQRD